MTDDALAPWIAAYREENQGTSLDVNGIRRRVLTAVGSRRRGRFGAVRFVLPVAATFFGSVALAASQGMLPRLDEVREWLGMAATESGKRTDGDEGRARSAPVRRAPPPVVRNDETVPPAEPSRPTEAAPAPGLSLDELPVEKSARAPRARSEETPAAPTAPPVASAAPPVDGRDALSTDLRAYQVAHRLHFDGGDPKRALVAWDAYLDAYPAGTFAPEARFNRAVCLLRLGRRDEAQSVLVPIAESSFAFGRDRARALLEAMGN